MDLVAAGRFLAPTPEGAGLIGSWSPGIGDPSLMGWFTVACYGATSWSCIAVARRLKLPTDRAERLLWTLLAVLYAALGVNKQLDLQSAFTEVGRIVARRQDWYETRRAVQETFVLIVAVLAAFATAATLWMVRNLTRQAQLAVVGAGFLLAFIVVRAASFHGVDHLIRRSLWQWLRINWLLELGGIGTTFVASCLRLRSPRFGGSPLRPSR